MGSHRPMHIKEKTVRVRPSGFKFKCDILYRALSHPLRSELRARRVSYLGKTHKQATPKAHTYCFLSWLCLGLPEPITCTVSQKTSWL